MNRNKFLQVVAHELLHYETKALSSPHTSPNVGKFANRGLGFDELHQIVKANREKRCQVCTLELRQYSTIAKRNLSQGAEEKIKAANNGVRSRVSMCIQCGFNAHNYVFVKEKKFIHQLFPEMSCMEILHSDRGKEIWSVKKYGDSTKVTVKNSHPVVKEMRKSVEDYIMANTL